MNKLFLNVFPFIALILLSNSLISQSNIWTPTGEFPLPGAINIYCLSENYGWCNNISVGGYSNTGNYPLFTSNDCGSTWINIGPHLVGTVYSVAQECSVIGTKYAVIRDGNNGLYRYNNTYGWELKCCGGLDPRCVVQQYGTVLCGSRGTGRGIYRSTNDGDSFEQIYTNADIYCLEFKNNVAWAGGSYTSGAGILLKANGYPFGTWNEAAYLDGYVIGIAVTNDGNVFAATHHGYLYRSLNGGSFSICRSDINWDELKIPLVCASDGTIFYGDYQNGIFCSTDNGDTWISLSGGLPNNHIIDLAVDPCNDKIYAALGGSLSTHIYRYEQSHHNVLIPAGWSGISSYVDPLNDSVTAIFNPIEDELVILMNNNQVYWPDQGINTIINWNSHGGYKIKVGDASQLTFTGPREMDKTIDLLTGWSIIPVLNNTQVSTDDLFGPLGDTLTLVKEIAGINVYWPSEGITTLEYLYPGKAYCVHVSHNCSIHFPEYSKRISCSTKDSKNYAPTSWNEVTLTGFSYTIAIDNSALSELLTGDIIGIFNPGGLCCGASEIVETNVSLGLTAFGDDPTTEQTDGLTDDEPISFRLFRPSTTEEFQLDVTFDPVQPDDSSFVNDGISKITDITINASSIRYELNQDLVTIFPNPSDGIINISFGHSCEHADVSVYDGYGKCVYTCVFKMRTSDNTLKINLSKYKSGMYFIKIEYERKVGYHKVVLHWDY